MKTVDVILHDIKTKPEAWRIDEFWARHQSGTAIWLGNGFWGCHVKKPQYQEFNLMDRFKLYRALRQLERTEEGVT
ncbi:hypothetical protein WDW89_24340 [Deltaproteobacteria bacterium TL4]